MSVDMRKIPRDMKPKDDIIRAPHSLVVELVSTVEKEIGLKPTRWQAIRWLLDELKRQKDSTK